MDLFSPFSCQLQHIAFDRLKSVISWFRQQIRFCSIYFNTISQILINFMSIFNHLSNAHVVEKRD